MITKKQIIITQYLKMNYDLHMYVIINLFPDFVDVIDLIFYFNYYFIDPSQHVQLIEDILEINNVVIEDDEVFGKVCDIIIDFLNLIKRL